MSQLRPRKGRSQGLVVGTGAGQRLFALNHCAVLLWFHGPGVPRCPGSPNSRWHRCLLEQENGGTLNPALNPSLCGPPPYPAGFPQPPTPPGRSCYVTRDATSRGGNSEAPQTRGRCALCWTPCRKQDGDALGAGRALWSPRVLVSDRTRFVDPQNSFLTCCHSEPGPGFISRYLTITLHQRFSSVLVSGFLYAFKN